MKAHPDLFVKDGTPEREWGTPFDSSIAAADAMVAVIEAKTKPKPSIDRATRADDIVVCTWNIFAGPGGAVAREGPVQGRTRG